MTKTDLEYTQPVGLDIGTSRIVVARCDEKKYRYESQLNAFLTLPYSRLAESLLEREKVFHEVRGAEIVVAGNDAQRFAEVFHVETRRPMANGVLNPQEPHSLPVIRSIVTRLVGKAAAEGQKAYFSVPAPLDGAENGIAYHQASIGQILTELGYAPTPIAEGLAVVFGELADANFSGIGISCGSGLCNVCLAVLSVPVISFSMPKAGDYIDNQSAIVTGDLAVRMRLQKEQAFSSERPHRRSCARRPYGLLPGNAGAPGRDPRSHISSAQRLPKIEKSIPLVLSGGTAMPGGFLSHFVKVLASHELPVKLSEVRISADPLNSTARGALMAALC